MPLMKTMENLSRYGLQMRFLRSMNTTGALVRPKGTTMNSKCLYLVLNAVLEISSSRTEPKPNKIRQEMESVEKSKVKPDKVKAKSKPKRHQCKLLAVATTFTGSRNLYCQWELLT
nr:hypothetical protein [Tanacetum cinerariifolium]